MISENSKVASNVNRWVSVNLTKPRDYSKAYSVKRVAIVFPGRGEELKLIPGHSPRELFSSPLGVGYIASSLSQVLGIEVKIIDLNIPGKDLRKELKEFRPELVGVSVLKVHTKIALEIAAFLAEEFPEVIRLAGGAQPTLSPHEFLPAYDFVIRGEGERSTVDLLRALERGKNFVARVGGLVFYDGNRLISNAVQRIEELDSLPFPAMDFTGEYPDYVQGGEVLIASRGCPFGCIFCTKELFGSDFKRRSNQNIIAEIEWYIDRYGAANFQFRDDVFTLSRIKTKEFCREIIRRGLEITWGCATRADVVDRETLRLMYRAGCRRISFGVESGDESVLRLLDKRQDVLRNLKAIKAAREIGYDEVKAFLIVGLPGQDEASIDKTIKFLQIAKPTSIVVHYFTPFPGTPAFTERDALGIKFLSDPSDPEVWDKFYHSGPMAVFPIVETREMTAPQIFEAKRRILAAFTKADEHGG